MSRNFFPPAHISPWHGGKASELKESIAQMDHPDKA